VTPGVGAWTLQAADGYPSDGDSRSDGVTTVSLSTAKSLTPGVVPGPPKLGTIVVAFDFYSLAVETIVLDAPTLEKVH
jgi:hypothetical protein